MTGRPFSFLTLLIRFVCLLLLVQQSCSLALPSTQVNRRNWCSTAAAAAFLVASPPRAAYAASTEASMTEADCVKQCMKECTKLAPGEANKAYCLGTCEDYCRAAAEDGEPTGTNDVVRQDVS
jgi:hypothetical protein